MDFNVTNNENLIHMALESTMYLTFRNNCLLSFCVVSKESI